MKPSFSFNLLISLVLFSLFIGCKREVSVRQISADELSEVKKSGKPNILIILVDDVGYEIPTCNGGESYETPNIDKMAREGMRFTQCHSSPMCSPSRFMLLTGKYNFRNYSLWGELGQDQRTFANMLSDAGYATCYTGKWQLDGGSASAITFGWQKYSVWYPYKLAGGEEAEGSRYKSPKIYQDGDYLPFSETYNKYSDDIFTDYLMNFIDSASSKGKPFMAMYSMILVHGPVSPTPDDPEYATWDYERQLGDKTFFPSNVKYMDKKVGEILDHLKRKKLSKNTLVFFISDNGTQPRVESLWQGELIPGGKKTTTEAGTNVPCIAYCEGSIPAGSQCNALINFADFLPTFADVAGIAVPDYGPLDGVSFYNSLQRPRRQGKRNTIYNSYAMSPGTGHEFRTWVQDTTYKLYGKKNAFVKISKCHFDSDPIPDNKLTPEERAIKENFTNILKSYNSQF